MKKIIVILLLFVTHTIHAQKKDTLSISAGFMSAPQGMLLLDNPKQGFKTIAPVFLSVVCVKGSLANAVFYNMTFNSIGDFISIDFNKTYGGYIVGTYSVKSQERYLGIGFTRSVANGKAQGFVEFGTSLDGSSLQLYTGVFIPFMFKIK